MAAKGSDDVANARASGRSGGWLAAGGLLGALLASSCCLVPLVLVTLGVSGAWIGKLTALQPYSPLFAALALLCIGLGFWHVYFPRPAEPCEVRACAPGRSRAITKAVLWIAAVVTIVALTTGWWAPLFY
ncbi:MAG TPA: mercuric transporter MerT family protein [Allosphingosinicella sp.]|jgi:mercuric ion transport protein|nr:mercuric transporter MerT family protein [Allosphingosinicella sp.]